MGFKGKLTKLQVCNSQTVLVVCELNWARQCNCMLYVSYQIRHTNSMTIISKTKAAAFTNFGFYHLRIS